MDIDLLAKMVKEAILDHDTVTLPGVGCFVAELVSSTFSDKGYTINPPYRRLYFSPRQGSDTLLAGLYARDNAGVDLQMATRILTDYLAEMKEVLKVRKTVVFPGLGRLRATRENHFFFVADEDLDIYPEGLGLAPLSLKTHTETAEEVASAVAGLAGLISDPVPSEAEARPEPEEISPRAALGRNDREEPESGGEIPDQVGNDGKEPEVETEAEPVVEPESALVDEPMVEPEVEPMVEPEPEPEEISPRAALGRNDREETESGGEIPDQVGNDGKEPEVETEAEPVVEPEVEPMVEPEPEPEEISPRAALGRNDREETEPVVEPEPEPEEISPRAALGRNDREPAPMHAQKPVQKQKSKQKPKPKRRGLRALVIVLVALLVLLVAFILIGRFAPGVLDSLLYSKEELEILRY